MGKHGRDNARQREVGKIGGKALLTKEFYQKIGGMGGKATREKHGLEYYKTVGTLGGKTGGEKTKSLYGKNFYAEIGKLGGAKLRKIILAGKAALAVSQDDEKPG